MLRTLTALTILLALTVTSATGYDLLKLRTAPWTQLKTRIHDRNFQFTPTLLPTTGRRSVAQHICQVKASLCAYYAKKGHWGVYGLGEGDIEGCGFDSRPYWPYTCTPCDNRCRTCKYGSGDCEINGAKLLGDAISKGRDGWYRCRIWKRK